MRSQCLLRSSSSIANALILRKRNKRKGKRRWMTRQELLCKYNRDETFVDFIITRKKQEGRTREHPDAPGELIYLCVAPRAKPWQVPSQVS